MAVTITKQSTYQWRIDNPERWKAMKMRSYFKHREKNLDKFKDRYQKNKEKVLADAAIWRGNDREKLRFLARARYARLATATKIEVFTHYGANHEMRCSWNGCEISDIDMLSIDHIDGGGRNHRKTAGTGFGFYRWLIRNKFPEGFQTLCMNHQMKKEAMKRKRVQ